MTTYAVSTAPTCHRRNCSEARHDCYHCGPDGGWPALAPTASADIDSYIAQLEKADAAAREAGYTNIPSDSDDYGEHPRPRRHRLRVLQLTS